MQHLSLDRRTLENQVVDGNNYLINKMQSQTGGLVVRETLAEITACKSPPIFVFDPYGGNDRRKAKFPNYKAARQNAKYAGARESYWEALKRFRSLLQLVSCVYMQVPGWEADDVIATLARTEAKAGRKCRVITTDRDLSQLAIDPLIWVASTEGAKVRPSQIRLYKTLVGDPSDSIPGIPGFGPASWGRVNQQLMINMLTGVRTHYNETQLGLSPSHFKWVSENFDQLLIFWDIVNLYEVPPEEIVSGIKVGTHSPAILDKILKDHLL
jgi:hypothetical protein